MCVCACACDCTLAPARNRWRVGVYVCVSRNLCDCVAVRDRRSWCSFHSISIFEENWVRRLKTSHITNSKGKLSFHVAVKVTVKLEFSIRSCVINEEWFWKKACVQPSYCVKCSEIWISRFLSFPLRTIAVVDLLFVLISILFSTNYIVKCLYCIVFFSECWHELAFAWLFSSRSNYILKQVCSLPSSTSCELKQNSSIYCLHNDMV